MDFLLKQACKWNSGFWILQDRLRTVCRHYRSMLQEMRAWRKFNMGLVLTGRGKGKGIKGNRGRSGRVTIREREIK